MNTSILNMRDDRKKSIVQNTPVIFEIASNENANGSAPWFEADSRLTMAIMYTTHGYYERLYPDF